MNNLFGPEVCHSPDYPVCNDPDFFHCETELTLIKKVLKSFFCRTLVADHAERKATQSTKKRQINNQKQSTEHINEQHNKQLTNQLLVQRTSQLSRPPASQSTWQATNP